MESEHTPTKKRRAAAGFGLLAVQSISCAVVVLAVLVLRLLGGGVFRQLGDYFQEAMQQNALTAAIHALWDDEVLYPPTTTTPAVTTTSPAAGGAAVTTPTNVAASTWRGAVPAAAPLDDAVISSRFGERSDPFGGGEEFHTGIDLAAASGTPIAAMWDGEVVATDVEGSGSLGKYIRLRHADGVEVLYAHCDTLAVAVGDTVTAGQTVATVGSTGRSTGAHLHIEVQVNGELYDPAPLLAGVGYV